MSEIARWIIWTVGLALVLIAGVYGVATGNSAMSFLTGWSLALLIHNKPKEPL